MSVAAAGYSCVARMGRCPLYGLAFAGWPSGSATDAEGLPDRRRRLSFGPGFVAWSSPPAAEYL